MASIERGKVCKWETDQEDIAIIQARDDDNWTRLVAVKVVSSHPVFIYFEGSVSSGLGLGFGLSN